MPCRESFGGPSAHLGHGPAGCCPLPQKLQSNLANTEQRVVDLDSQLQQVIIDLERLRDSYDEQNRELQTTQDKLVILSEEKEAQSRQLVSLEADYSTLKVKYDKLVKPARTAKGKYVHTIYLCSTMGPGVQVDPVSLDVK